MNQEINNAIVFAKQYSDAAPKGFEEAAFQTALHYYLIDKNNQNESNSNQPKKTSTPKPDFEDHMNRILNEDYDWFATKIPKLTPVGQHLHLLQIAKNEFGINMLSAEEIRTVLNEKFRINKTINNIGMSLMKKVGVYVDRIKQGNGYYYKITYNGESFLNTLLKDLDE